MGSFSQGFSDGFDIGLPNGVGRFRFLKDHFIGGEYIFAGEIREMFHPWVPTPDVEPLNYIAATSLYNVGPQLGGVWRTIRVNASIYPPVTYWKSIAPNTWALTGIGASFAPISAILSRVEDKEV